MQEVMSRLLIPYLDIISYFYVGLHVITVVILFTHAYISSACLSLYPYASYMFLSCSYAYISAYGSLIWIEVGMMGHYVQ